MRLGGTARYTCLLKSDNDILEAVAFANSKKIKLRVIGIGSNIIWSDGNFDGLLAISSSSYIKISDEQMRIGAGTNWDDVVALSVENNLSGIEYLSLIPGTAGATPIQNVGAYGSDIQKVLVNLKAYDTKDGCFVRLNNADCNFGYRSSRFNTTDAGRFIISEITLKLSTKKPNPPFYESLQVYLDKNNITNYTSLNIREAVIAIRSSKLPDPSKIANTGSFFANPIIDNDTLKTLSKNDTNLKYWRLDSGYKVSAAWLIENSGFKDYHDEITGMATWASQPLVLINENAKSTADLIQFRDKIVKTVNNKFGIVLQQEPELLS